MRKTLIAVNRVYTFSEKCKLHNLLTRANHRETQ